jgi:hypothetical protein
MVDLVVTVDADYLDRSERVPLQGDYLPTSGLLDLHFVFCRRVKAIAESTGQLERAA